MNKDHISFEVLSRYRDGEFFPASMKAKIEAHLQKCSECRSELEKIEKMITLVRALSSYGIAYPLRMRDKIMAHIERERKGALFVERRWYKRFTIPSAVAAIVIVAIGLLVVSTEIVYKNAMHNNVNWNEQKQISESHRVIEAMNAVRNAGAVVVEVSDAYLMVEAPVETLGHIRQTLFPYSIEIVEYFYGRSALAVSSSNLRTRGQRNFVKFKIILK